MLWEDHQKVQRVDYFCVHLCRWSGSRMPIHLSVGTIKLRFKHRYITSDAVIQCIDSICEHYWPQHWFHSISCARSPILKMTHFYCFLSVKQLAIHSRILLITLCVLILRKNLLCGTISKSFCKSIAHDHLKYLQKSNF